MLANFPCGRTLILTGFVLLIGGGMVEPLQPTFASPSSQQDSLSIPARRKPGSSRQLTEMPNRRKPGGSREDYAQVPGRRKPGSTREDYVEVPGRRNPGGSREDYAQVPGRRKPGSARTDIALLLDQNLLGNTAAYCDKDIRQMTALIPENMESLTASATPTLYFAVPILSNAPKMEFVLQDDQQRVIYTATLTPQVSGGIMSLKIPSSHALEANKTYHWYLSAICDANYRERDLVVEGLVKRVQANHLNGSASNLEQQQSAFWQDRLHTAISLYQQEGYSENLQEEWQGLVKSVNLPEFSDLLEEQNVFESNAQPLSSQ